MDRRRFLRTSGLATLATLAGCAGDGGSSPEPTGTETTAGTTATTADGTPTTAGTTTGETTGTETTTQPGTTAGTTGTTTTATTTTPATTTTSQAESAVEVVVGADGRTRFGPESFVLAVGGTVTWVWNGSGHNVVPDSQPEAADWSGTPGGRSRTYDEGYEYEYTFDVPGEYEYYCSVHRAFGMTGSFSVVEP